MELYQLRSFVMVAREGNLSRAAERLFTSQPAVSAQIKSLEDELVVKLFERTPRGMRLTGPGAVLLDEAEKALAAASGMLARAQSMQGDLAGTLRLCIVTDALALRLGDFMARMTGLHPRVAIKLMQGHSGTAVAALRAGEVDAAYAVGEMDGDDLLVLRLREMRMVLVGPVAWRARIEGASLEALADMPWVGTPPNCSFSSLTAALFRDHPRQPRRWVSEVDQEGTVRSLVESGIGLALLREDQARVAEAAGQVVVRDDLALVTSLCFLTRRERAGEGLIEAALEQVRAVWPEAR